MKTQMKTNEQQTENQGDTNKQYVENKRNNIAKQLNTNDNTNEIQIKSK